VKLPSSPILTSFLPQAWAEKEQVWAKEEVGEALNERLKF
jgi:hypothetical protein